MSRVFALRPLGLGLAAEDGIIPAQVALAMTDADLILARAREKAEEITAEAVAAREAEMHRGYAEGRAQAQAEAVAWLQQARQDLSSRLDRIQMDLADLVVASVRRILHGFEDDRLALETVRSALASLRSEKRLQLHVAPKMEAAVRAALPGFLVDYPEIQLIDVIVDPGLTPPDLRIESELGTVTLVLEETLEDLGRLLRGGQGGG